MGLSSCWGRGGQGRCGEKGPPSPHHSCAPKPVPPQGPPVWVNRGMSRGPTGQRPTLGVCRWPGPSTLLPSGGAVAWAPTTSLPRGWRGPGTPKVPPQRPWTPPEPGHAPPTSLPRGWRGPGTLQSPSPAAAAPSMATPMSRGLPYIPPQGPGRPPHLFPRAGGDLGLPKVPPQGLAGTREPPKVPPHAPPAAGRIRGPGRSCTCRG